MAFQTQVMQTNFTAGELSPRLEGRTDLAKYFNSAKTIENFTVLPYGGAMRRPGTKYISTAKANPNLLTNAGMGDWTGLQNVADNPDFESWTTGSELLTNGNMETASPPSSWTLGGAGAAWAREATIIHGGTYSGKLTRAAADCYVYQDVASPTTYRGKYVVFGGWVYATKANVAFLNIKDDSGETSSAYHSGSSTWEYLTVTRLIDLAATYVRCACYVYTTATSAYFDDVSCKVGVNLLTNPEMATWASTGLQSNADIDNEDMADITDWTDADGVGTGAASTQVTFDGKSCMKLYSGTTNGATNYAARYQDIGTFGASTVYNMSLYFEAIGTSAASDSFLFLAQDQTNLHQIQVLFCSDGLKVLNSSGVFTSVGTNPVVQEVWQEYTFKVTWGASPTVDIYLNGALFAAGIDCAYYDASVVEGIVEFIQYGSTTAGRTTYIDWFNAGSAFNDPLTGWPMDGARATIQQSTGLTYATPSAKLTENGTTANIQQQIAGGTAWRGKTACLGAWVYSSVASRTRIALSDDVSAASYSYHSGNSTWEYLTCVFTVPVTGAALRVLLVQGSGGTTSSCYFDNISCYEMVAPTGWTLSGTGATVVREEGIKKSGFYSAKVTSVADYSSLYRALNIGGALGKTYVFGAWVYCPAGKNVRVTLFDGTGTANTYHSSAAGWEYLSVTYTAVAADMYAFLVTESVSTTAHFDKSVAYEMLSPDDWTLSGTGATVAREEGVVHSGSYAAKLTRAGTNCYLLQDLASPASYQGKTLSFGAWVYCLTSDVATVALNDGDITFTTYHKGTGWEYLSATKTISATAALVRCSLYILGADASAMFDGISVQEYGSTQCRLISFQFSTEQAYIIEIGNEYMRFYKDQGQIVKTLADTASWVAATAYVVGNFVKYSSVIYYCIEAHTSSSTWAPNEEKWVAQTAYEIPTDYLGADILKLQFAQSADVLYITHPDYPPTKLQRYDHADWVLEEIQFVEGPYLDSNISNLTMAAAATTGSTTITIAAPAWAAATEYHIGDYVTNSGNTFKCIVPHTSSAAFATDQASKWSDEDIAVFTADHVGALFRKIAGYVQITAVTSGTVATALVVGTVTTAATTDWSEGAWSAARGYPSCVTFYEQRLYFAATIFQPQTLWGSKIGLFENFGVSDPILDDDSIQYTLYSEQVNTIRWLLTGKILFMGTSGGYFTLSSGTVQEPVTPTNVVVQRESTYGAAEVVAEKIGNAILYPQSFGKKVREVNYEYLTDGYTAEDVTIFADHIAEAGIVDMDYQMTPCNILWGVLADGDMALMTREAKQEVISWYRVTTLGLFKSVAVIPGVGEDEVWVSVERNINGTPVRTVEMFMPHDWGTDQEDCFFVDCGLTYDGVPVTTLSGLDHLEGETVSVLADGVVIEDLVVTSGAITLTTAASKVHVGLPYTSTILTNRIELGDNKSTSQGKIKRIAKLWARLYKSLGFKMGSELVQDYPEFDSDIIPYTGDKEIHFPDGYDNDARVKIVQEQPLPLTVSAIFALVNVND